MGGAVSPRFEPRALRGAYAVVNRRIADLLEARDPLLSVEDVGISHGAPGSERARQREGDWCPPAALLCEEDDRATFDALRQRQAGAFVTSYTRMRSEWSTPRGAYDEATQPTDVSPETDLRGARSSGVFLHELLERVPLDSFAASATFDAWRSRLDVVALFDEAMPTHRIERTQREHAERLVWGAYTTAVSLPGGGRLERIATAPRVVREMDFVFAMREALEAESPLRGVRGYVRGAIDLAFDLDGLTYFVDWKSDSLPSYSPQALERRVRDHYESQAQLYAVAIVKLLGVRTEHEHEARFGGMIYCFLRGFEAGGHGIWSARPGWRQVLEWENALRAPRNRSVGPAS